MPQILAVLVLYSRGIRRHLDLAPIYKAIESERTLLSRLVLFDNSPEPALFTGHKGLHPGITYFWNRTNGGTKAAYEYAADIAYTSMIDHITFLDQDTLVTYDYFVELSKAIRSNRSGDCFVPVVRTDAGILSPAYFSIFGVSPCKVDRGVDATRVVTCISSCSTFSVRFLRTIMPLPRKLWLDNLDHWIFFNLHIHGRKPFLLDCNIGHSLSVQSVTSLDSSRARNIAESELMLYFICFGSIGLLITYMRLFLRLVRYLFVNRQAAKGIYQAMASGRKAVVCKIKRAS